MTVYRKKKMPTMAEIKRNPPPGAKGYKGRQAKPKPQPATSRRGRR